MINLYVCKDKKRNWRWTRRRWWGRWSFLIIIILFHPLIFFPLSLLSYFFLLFASNKRQIFFLSIVITELDTTLSGYMKTLVTLFRSEFSFLISVSLSTHQNRHVMLLVICDDHLFSLEFITTICNNNILDSRLFFNFILSFSFLSLILINFSFFLFFPWPSWLSWKETWWVLLKVIYKKKKSVSILTRNLL